MISEVYIRNNTICIPVNVASSNVSSKTLVTSDSTDNPMVLLAGVIPNHSALNLTLIPSYEIVGGLTRPCADVYLRYLNKYVDLNTATVQYYFDNVAVKRFNDVINLKSGVHSFGCVVTYKGITTMVKENLAYEN